jgi:hypothetical protein
MDRQPMEVPAPQRNPVPFLSPADRSSYSPRQTRGAG